MSDIFLHTYNDILNAKDLDCPIGNKVIIMPFSIFPYIVSLLEDNEVRATREEESCNALTRQSTDS